MSTQLSVLYMTADNSSREQFGFKNENEARALAHSLVRDCNYRNVVLRCTEQQGHITITHWAEPFGDTIEDELATMTEKYHEALAAKDQAELDLAHYIEQYQIPDIERRELRDEPVSWAWIRDFLAGLAADLVPQTQAS